MKAIVYYDFHMFFSRFFFWIVIVLTTSNAEILEWDNDAKIAPTGHQTQATWQPTVEPD